MRSAWGRCSATQISDVGEDTAEQVSRHCYLGHLEDGIAGMVDQLRADLHAFVDVLQDRLPEGVAELLRVRRINHSAVAVAELSHLLGRLDPAHPQTAKVCQTVQATSASIPVHRLQAPSVAVMTEAGMLAGMHARLQGLQRQDRQPLLNDALLFLQALSQGCHLLTRNIADMDYLQQLQPGGQVLFYRQKA